MVAAIITCLLIGGILGYAMSNLANLSQIHDLQNQVSSLKSTQDPNENVTAENITYVLAENFSLSQLYDQVKDSVVVVQGMQPEYNFFGQIYSYAEVQGSGFVYNSTGQCAIITNYHVIQDAINITVTFTNGDAYAAKVVGSDPYEDLTVLSANASQDEGSPLTIASTLFP